MSETTGWKRCQHGKFYKEIGPYRFRLHDLAVWVISIEYIDPPLANTLNEAKRLAHKLARELGVEE